ncbi:MAG TPA: glycosyltransferase family 4 protein [Gemmatimonadales bacterium]|jgi:glycosyltransferase involved in cell wall biosynthesis
MNVLHLTLSAARGGRRDAILTLIDHLRPLGVSCGLVALRNTPLEIAELGPRTDYVAGLEFMARPSLKELRQVRQLCRDRRVDLIHAHDHGSQYVASAIRVVSPSVRAVMTFHRTLGIETEGPRNRLRNGLSLPLISRVMTASADRRKYFIDNTLVNGGRVVVIPLGVDLQQFRPAPAMRTAIRTELGIPADRIVALTIGHFGPEKGLDQVLEAAGAAMRQTNRPWHLVVLGTGDSDRAAMLRETAERLLPGQVSFMGFRTDVVRWLQGADLLIHAPRLEAFGLVVVQAMACGIPVIGAAVGGVPEIVIDQVTGMLVPSGDSDRLGQEIARVISNDEMRLRLGERALGRAMQHYDARESARLHMALYRQITSRSVAGPPEADWPPPSEEQTW